MRITLDNKLTVKEVLRPDEYEHLVVTLEGAKEELEMLSDELDWYVTALPERIDDALAIIGAVDELPNV